MLMPHLSLFAFICVFSFFHVDAFLQKHCPSTIDSRGKFLQRIPSGKGMKMSNELYSPPPSSSSSSSPSSPSPYSSRPPSSSSSSYSTAARTTPSAYKISTMSGEASGNSSSSASAFSPTSSVGASSPSSTLKKTFDRLTTSLLLEKTDYTDTMERSSWNQKGYRGTMIGGKDQPNRLTWYNYARTEGENGSGVIEEHLNLWVGCLVDVPHVNIMIRKNSKSSDQSLILLDFIPREDSGYIANRYMEKYYLSTVYQELTKPLLQNGGSFLESVPPTNPNLRLLLSPTYLYGTISDSALPDTISKFISTWENWMNNAEEVQRMKRGQLLSRDTGLRRAWFDYQKEMQITLIEAKTPAEIEFATETAAALSGPQQMAYTGQAS